MNPILLLGASAATVYYLSRKPAKDWKGFVSTLGVVAMQSKIDFCRSVVLLQDPKTTKVEGTFQVWADTQIKLGSAVLIDSNIQNAALTEASIKAYAVDPKKVAELTSNGTFVEYKP